jgi:glycosyltransferase involved in cell wall biosynthesis
MQNRICVIILTRDEATHIARAIGSVERVAAQTYVVDSFSTDSTIEIAEQAGAVTVQHAFVTQAQQFQWALDNLPIESDWVMRLDADEALTPELVDEIARELPGLPPDVTGVNLNRRHIFLDRWIRHGGRYPLTLLRIWRRGAARIEQRWMDEHMVLLHGRAVTFKHDFSDHNLNDLTFFTDKHNRYATREAIDRMNAEFDLFERDKSVIAGRSNPQARAKRFLKEKLYDRLPFGVGPLAYFMWRYVFQLGFLDGRAGLAYHFLQGFWYRFLVDAKVEEFAGRLRALPERAEKRRELARLTGYCFDMPARPLQPDSFAADRE